MSWDPVLLRKFSTTGHFRLLNQLRTELKAQPLQRQAPEALDSARPRTGRLVRAVEVRPQSSSGYGRQRRSSAVAPSTAASASGASAVAAPLSRDAAASAAAEAAASQASSFRDRLNAIDMR